MELNYYVETVPHSGTASMAAATNMFLQAWPGLMQSSTVCLEEHQFVKVLISNFDPTEGYTWIGLTDLHKERGWMWSDGSPVDFTYWTSNQPDNMGGNEHCS